MTSLQEFIDKYKGKSIDWDGAYGGQCVDLFRQYCNEVLGITQPKSVAGAADFWSNYDTDSVLNQNFTKIKNSPEFIPQAGDVALWNRNMGGGFGHVGVCTGKGDTNTFESFDQNWSKVSYCELVNHPYTNFYGVLRFNKQLVETLYRGYDLTNKDSMKICVDDHIKVAEGQLVDAKLYEAIKGQLTKSEENVQSLSSQLGTANSTIQAQLKKIESQTTIIEKFNDEDAVQIRQLRESYEKETKANNLLWDTINEWADILKYKVGSDDAQTIISGLTEALQSLVRAKASNTQPKPIVITPSKSVIIDIIRKLFGGK